MEGGNEMDDKFIVIIVLGFLSAGLIWKMPNAEITPILLSQIVAGFLAFAVGKSKG